MEPTLWKLAPLNVMNRNGWMYGPDSFLDFPQVVPIVDFPIQMPGREEFTPQEIIGGVMNLQIEKQEDGTLWIVGNVMWTSPESESKYGLNSLLATTMADAEDGSPVLTGVRYICFHVSDEIDSVWEPLPDTKMSITQQVG